MIANGVTRHHSPHIDGIRIVAVSDNPAIGKLGRQEGLKPRGLGAWGGPGSVAVAFEAMYKH